MGGDREDVFRHTLSRRKPPPGEQVADLRYFVDGSWIGKTDAESAALREGMNAIAALRGVSQYRHAQVRMRGPLRQAQRHLAADRRRRFRSPLVRLAQSILEGVP